MRKLFKGGNYSRVETLFLLILTRRFLSTNILLSRKLFKKVFFENTERKLKFKIDMLKSYNKAQKNSKYYLHISFEGLHTLKSSSHHICFRGWQKTGQVLHGVSGHTFTIVGVHILTSWFLLMTCVSVVHFFRPKVSQNHQVRITIKIHTVRP